MASNSFRINVDTSELVRALNTLGYETQNVVSQFLSEEALLWQRDIRQKLTDNKSVLSGDLRRSISVQPKNKFEYRVSTNLFYAPFVEYGTRRSGAKPYFTPVYNQREAKFKATLTAILREAFR